MLLTLDGDPSAGSGTETLETTAEHPFYVVEVNEWSSYLSSGHWVDAGELQVGDDVLQADGTMGEVVSVRVVAVTQPMYNLTVDQAHTFFVGSGQWLVHNAGCGIQLTQNYSFNRGNRQFKLTQGDSRSGWTHIWERHIDPNPGNTAFAAKSKFDPSWTETDITDLLGQTLKHGTESDYYGQSVFEFRTNYKRSGYRTYRATVNPDGTVQTFHPLD